MRGDCPARGVAHARSARAVGAVINGIPTFVGVTTNAGKATFKGLEVEALATLFREPTIEHLAVKLIPRSVGAGETIIREGDAGDLFYIVEDGRFTYANPRLCEWLGYTHAELIGMETLDVVAEDMIASLERNCRQFGIQLWAPGADGGEQRHAPLRRVAGGRRRWGGGRTHPVFPCDALVRAGVAGDGTAAADLRRRPG